jgi:hypothetical protein
MLSRLLVGCVVGLLAGAAVAAGLAFGLDAKVFKEGLGVVLAYGAAAVTGVLTGLVAGKPIWAQGASIEAGLKAVFGAILGTVAMFALRKWVGVSVDLTWLWAGAQGKLGDVPAASLPLLGAVLGGLFELDNTGDDSKEGARVRGRPGVRVDAGKADSAGARRTPSSAEGAPDEDDSERKRAKG